MNTSTRLFPVLVLFFVLMLSDSFSVAETMIDDECSSDISLLEPGDIICCEIRDILKRFGAHDVKTGFDHVALYLGEKQGIPYVIEAGYYPFLPNAKRVLIMPLWYLQLYSKITVIRVIGVNTTVCEQVLDFGRTQLNSPYQHLHLIPDSDPFRWHANHDPTDPIDPYADWYYCADFVWACYYNAGYDLDPVFPETRENNYVQGYGYLRFVSPQNIFDSNLTKEIY